MHLCTPLLLLPITRCIKSFSQKIKKSLRLTHQIKHGQQLLHDCGFHFSPYAVPGNAERKKSSLCLILLNSHWVHSVLLRM